MNEMVFAKLIAEEIVNELINRGVISVRGGIAYDPDKRVRTRDTKSIGYADVISALNREVSEAKMYNSSRQSIINIIPCSGDEEYFKAVIEIISDDSSLSSTKVDSVRRITNKFGYMK